MKHRPRRPSPAILVALGAAMAAAAQAWTHGANPATSEQILAGKPVYQEQVSTLHPPRKMLLRRGIDQDPLLPATVQIASDVCLRWRDQRAACDGAAARPAGCST
jgi:hypothetical protein